MRTRRHIVIPILLTFCLLTGCRSSPHRVADNVYWVYGRAFPFLAPIKQTNFETNFFDSVDLMIQKALRDQLLGKESVSIDPVAMWIVFSYPAKTHLAI